MICIDVLRMHFLLVSCTVSDGQKCLVAGSSGEPLRKWDKVENGKTRKRENKAQERRALDTLTWIFQI